MRTHVAFKNRRAPASTRRLRQIQMGDAGASLHRQRAEVRQILHGRWLQAKLIVGAPNDEYERDAERVADEMVRMPESKVMRMPQPNTMAERMHYPSEAERIQLAGEECGEKYGCPQHRQMDEKVESANDLAHGIRALRAGGDPLPDHTRAYFEPRFGAGLDHVRLHTGEAAAETARALEAQAFTLGHHIVFAERRYAPGTEAGKRLLAHELTHVLQQRPALRRAPDEPDQTQESSANPLPGFSQIRNTCNVASLVTALIIWDGQAGGAAGNHLAPAIDKIIEKYDREGEAIKARLERYNYDKDGNPRYDSAELYSTIMTRLPAIRELIQSSKAKMTNEMYVDVSVALYILFFQREISKNDNFFDKGLLSSETNAAIDFLGLSTGRPAEQFSSFPGIFSSETIQNLEPGQIAQVIALARSQGQHAFLIGRFSDGRWFLSDQGYSPAKEFVDTSLTDLEFQVFDAVQEGSYWLSFESNSGTISVLSEPSPQ